MSDSVNTKVIFVGEVVLFAVNMYGWILNDNQIKLCDTVKLWFVYVASGASG